MDAAFVEHEGVLVNSGKFTGMDFQTGFKAIMDEAEAQGFGKRKVNYRLRDWLISRQRYWGAPIPVIYCDKCGEVLVPEEDLPVELPDDVEFKQGALSPLSTSKKFNDCTCPKCGGRAHRETDTMDTFICTLAELSMRFCICFTQDFSQKFCATLNFQTMTNLSQIC